MIAGWLLLGEVEKELIKTISQKYNLLQEEVEIEIVEALKRLGVNEK